MTKTKTVMCVKNAEVLRLLELVRAEVKEGLECRRQPGVQVCLDALLKFYLEAPKDQRLAFLQGFETEIVGYPRSRRKNPGCFA